MACLGILSVRQDKSGFLEKLLLKVTLKEKFVTDFQVVVADLPFTAEELDKIPEWIKKRLYKRGIAYLSRNGADYMAMALSCKLDRGVIEKIPAELMEEATFYGLGFFREKDSLPSVCVSDKNGISLNFPFLARLCRMAKKIGVITDNIEKAGEIGEKLCDEYGVYPDICPWGEPFPKAEIQVDIDKRNVCIGKDFIINGIEYILDLGGYAVDTNSLKENHPEFFFKYARRAWLSGKKRLTR